MKLVAITVTMFRNFVDPQRITIEDDVTALVGKNESGKTTILTALHRLRPANSTNSKFDLTTEYPRWRLAPDRKANSKLADLRPITAEFKLMDEDLASLSDQFGVPLPEATVCFAARSYRGSYYVWLDCSHEAILAQAAETVSLGPNDLHELTTSESISDMQARAKELAKTLKESGEPLRSKAAASFAAQVGKYAFLENPSEIGAEQLKALGAMIPQFFYFSSYNVLPGECDLTVLTKKIEDEEDLSDEERTVVALLAHAGEQASDFLDANYNSRKAELQAASVDLSRSVFRYWRQNTDLEVIFDTDNVVTRRDPDGNELAHRILKVELRDGRHGNVETNFATRSSGFQWFFSFFAAFSEYQDSSESIVVLLDEPGTSLHGDAQRDFVRFIFDELGSKKQTIYTTHSQHMIDASRYEKLRAVHDRATREDPDQGVSVTLADFSTDRDTVLPLESALGYSISQHLFLGSGQHLAVEGSSDFIYLQRLTEYLVSQGKHGLDPRLSIIPVGGDANMPAFVALLGRRLKVSALIDGSRTSNKIGRVRAAAEHNGVPDGNIIAVSQIGEGVPTNADIEDIFEVSDYLRLYNWAFNQGVKAADLAQTTEPIIKRITDAIGRYDHALPAHALTEHREEFFASVKSKTISRAEKLFASLNATITDE